MVSTLAVRASVTPGRRSALRTRLTRGARAATASTAFLTTAIASSQSPSTVVNIASVLLGRPLERTTRTASATISPTSSPTPSGVTEKAMSMNPRLAEEAVHVLRADADLLVVLAAQLDVVEDVERPALLAVLVQPDERAGHVERDHHRLRRPGGRGG